MDTFVKRGEFDYAAPAVIYMWWTVDASYKSLKVTEEADFTSL